ncbi:lipase secretion chaperone [Pseudoalteromonas fenneropenaei]|uniref:Lipase chaperone n=1 Tax=Pseudoalteromonas fenneropenaei TaxID=1737459 RepID=A0ABV7CJF7_9GAMM
MVVIALVVIAVAGYLRVMPTDAPQPDSVKAGADNEVVQVQPHLAGLTTTTDAALPLSTAESSTTESLAAASITDCEQIIASRALLDGFMANWREADAKPQSACEQQLREQFTALQEAQRKLAWQQFTLAERVAILDELLRQHFSPAQYQRWFADEMQWHQGMLARQAILQDSHLTKEQQAYQLAESVAALPDAHQAAILPTLQLHESYQALNANALEAQTWLKSQPQVVQERITELQLEEAQWNKKLAAWRTFIAGEPDAAAAQAYLQREFSNTERKRVQVLASYP